MKRSCLLFISGACLPLLASAPVFAANPDSTEFSVEVKPYLNVTLSDADIHLPITPSSTGAFGSADFSASASTNSALGYSLSLSYLDENDNPSTDLISNTINVNDGTFPTIPTFTTNDELTSEAFAASTSEDHLNHWAISVNDTAHYKKAAQGTTIASSNGPIADDETTINLATKLDLRTVPGSYSVVMNFQVVANPNPITTLGDAFGNNNKIPVTIGGEDYYKIQDMTTSICDSVNEPNSTLRVVDIRDDTIYTIGKLADGRCWLLDNLALDLTSSTVLNNLTTDNTNADATALGYLKGTTTRDPSTDPDGNYATAGVSNWTSGQSYSVPLVNVSSKDIVPVGYYDDVVGEYFDDIVKDEVINGAWSVGGYYNLCAASAGSYCYGNGDISGKASGDMTADICPSNWRVPTGGTSGEYRTLTNTIINDDITYIEDHDSVASIRIALRLPLSGNYYNDGAYGQGAYGYFWSSTNYGRTSMYYLDVDALAGELNIDSNNGSTATDGISVRCIAK